MSSASSISSPHSSISWKARLRRSLSNQEKLQSPLSNVFNPGMTQSENGDGKSSTENLSVDAHSGYVAPHERNYDIDPASGEGSGDEDDYPEEHQRTITSNFIRRSLSDRPRSSVDSTASGAGTGADMDTSNAAAQQYSSTPVREEAFDRFIPIIQPQSPQSESNGVALSAPTRSSYGNSHHYHQYLPIHIHGASRTRAQGIERQRDFNRSIDFHKSSSQEEQDSSPPTSPVTLNIPSPYSATSSSQPTEIPTARKTSSLASSPSSYQRHHSVYVLSGQMFKDSPQGSPKSHLVRVLASDQENYYSTDSDSDCWGGKPANRKKSVDRVFSDSDADDDGKQKRAPIRGFQLAPRTPLRLEYDSDPTTALNTGHGSGKLDKLLSSPSLSAFGGISIAASNSLPAFFPDLSANAPQNLVSQIGFMDDTNELNAANALIQEMVQAKSKSDAEIRIVLDGWYECKRDRDIACISFQQEIPESYGPKCADNGSSLDSPNQWNGEDLRGSSFQQRTDSINWYEANIGPLDRVPAIHQETATINSSRHNSVSGSDQGQVRNATPRPIVSSGEAFEGERSASGQGDSVRVNSQDSKVAPIDMPVLGTGVMTEVEESSLRDVSRKRSILSRRIIASNSWPPTILASSHTTLLISIECISQQILHTPVAAIIAHPLKAVDIMKSLQTLMDRQRRMAVGNAEAEDLLTKLHEQHLSEDYQRSQAELPSGNLLLEQNSPLPYADWSPLPSPAMPVQLTDDETPNAATTPTEQPKEGSHTEVKTQTSITTEPQGVNVVRRSPKTSATSRSSLEQRLSVKSEGFAPSQCVVAQHANSFSTGEIQLQSTRSVLNLPVMSSKRSSAPPLSRTATSDIKPIIASPPTSGSSITASEATSAPGPKPASDAILAPSSLQRSFTIAAPAPSSASFLSFDASLHRVESKDAASESDSSGITGAPSKPKKVTERKKSLSLFKSIKSMFNQQQHQQQLEVQNEKSMSPLSPLSLSQLSPNSPSSSGLSSPLATSNKPGPLKLPRRSSVTPTSLIRSHTMDSSSPQQIMRAETSQQTLATNMTDNDMSLTVCRICDEEILLSLLDRHSETCKLQHECSQKLESCNHALGKLSVCVWQRREVIAAMNRPYMDYHSLKDSEKIQTLSEKACLVLESNPRHALRKLEKYHHKINGLLQESRNSAYDGELFSISKKIAHVIREKLLTMQTIQDQLALLTARDAGVDANGFISRSQSASAISSQSEVQSVSTSFWGSRKKSKAKPKDGLSRSTKPPLSLPISQTTMGISGKRTGLSSRADQGSSSNHTRRESTGSSLSAHGNDIDIESEAASFGPSGGNAGGIPIQSSLSRKGRSVSTPSTSMRTPPTFPVTPSEKPSKNFSTIFAAFLRVSRQRINSYNNLAGQSRSNSGDGESSRGGLF
ncbi:hypothetical protein BGZ54_000407, partial [Gamsiella multidivaricata]